MEPRRAGAGGPGCAPWGRAGPGRPPCRGSGPAAISGSGSGTAALRPAPAATEGRARSPVGVRWPLGEGRAQARAGSTALLRACRGGRRGDEPRRCYPFPSKPQAVRVPERLAQVLLVFFHVQMLFLLVKFFSRKQLQFADFPALHFFLSVRKVSHGCRSSSLHQIPCHKSNTNS